MTIMVLQGVQNNAFIDVRCCLLPEKRYAELMDEINSYVGSYVGIVLHFCDAADYF